MRSVGAAGNLAVQPPGTTAPRARSGSDAPEQIVDGARDGVVAPSGEQVVEHFARVAGDVRVVAVTGAADGIADREQREPRPVVVLAAELDRRTRHARFPGLLRFVVVG